MAEQAIFTVLVMVSDGSGNLLMEDRNDPSWPGICFPGGHVEPGEAFTAAEVFWLPRERLPEYPLVEDFMDMLKVFESDTLNEFQYYQEDNGEWGLRLL